MQEESIRVLLRMRPSNFGTNHFVKRNSSVSIVDQKKYAQMNKNYIFDSVYDCSSSTREIYESSIKQIIQASIHQEINSTIFTYGCTGSGKTFTMFGDPNSNEIDNRDGILLISLQQMIQRKVKQFQLSCSYIQIYNQQVHDLLCAQEQNYSNFVIYQDEQKKQFNVAGIKEVQLPTMQNAIQIVAFGQKNRKYAQTVRNRTSSRSHIIFRLCLKNREGRKHHINFVDLAGSEKLLIDKNSQRIHESKNINKSLFFLTQVVHILTKPNEQNFIPYRNSTLTKILKSSLGGNGRTCMILCVDPSEYQNSLSTIRFGCQAKQIKNKILHKKSSTTSDLSNLNRYENIQLKRELDEIKEKYEKILQQNKILKFEYEKQIICLNQKLNQKQKTIEILQSKTIFRPFNFGEGLQNESIQTKIQILENKLIKKNKKIEELKTNLVQRCYANEKLAKIILMYHNQYKRGLQKLSEQKLNQIYLNIEKLKQSIQQTKNSINTLKPDNRDQKSISHILRLYPEQFYNIPFLVVSKLQQR